jgi:hypothetical protein
MFSDEYVLKYYHDWFYFKELEAASGRSYKDLSDLLIAHGKDELDEDEAEYVFKYKATKTNEQLARELDKTLRAIRRSKKQSKGRIKTHFGVFQKQEKSPQTSGPDLAPTDPSVKKNLDNGSEV